MKEHIKAVGLIRQIEGIYVADEFDSGEKHVAYNMNLNQLKICISELYKKKFFPKKMTSTFTKQTDGVKYVIYTKGSY